MAAAPAQPSCPITFNSASNARHTQASAPSLSRGHLPTARKPPVASCQRHGCEGGDGATRRPAPRFLCLHGFRTSGEIMRRQVDAPFPAEGESPVRGAFDPPYYEWCHFVGEDFLKYKNFSESFANIEELMVRQGPFDGLFGFSQGALLSAALVGLQQQGLALNRVPRVNRGVHYS